MTADTIPAEGARRTASAAHGAVGLLGAAGIVVGSMIGSGVYLLPATLAAVGSISLLGWISAGAVAAAVAGVFVQLARLAPEARGVPAYIEAGLGRAFGVQGAVLYWIGVWAGLTPIALAAAGALGFIFPALAPMGVRMALTIGLIWAGVFAAWAGPRVVARVEALTLLLGLAPVILAATLGWFVFRPETFAASWNPQGLSVFAAVKTSALSCFWGFLGLETAAATAAVVRDPVRNVPRATLLGVGGATLIYIVVTAALMGMLPGPKLAASIAPFADAGEVLLAGQGVAAVLGVAVAACMALRSVGCLTGWMLVSAETSRTAADAGDFPPLFATRPGEHASRAGLLIPGVGMSIEALLSAQPNLAEQFSTLANATSLTCLYVYVLAALALLRLALRRPGGRRLPPLVSSVVAIGGALALIASGRPQELLLTLAPLAAGLGLHLWLRRR